MDIAGVGRHIENPFETVRKEVRLDYYEVRSTEGWYRHIMRALLAEVRVAELDWSPIQNKSLKD
ncbi:MAG: hypothetical protein OXC13_13605 [Caldilineaceae bacterium]|nr:hypothetical protein [Caldilineaceae bacterium]